MHRTILNPRNLAVIVCTAAAGCKFANSKEVAYVSAMKSDLRNLATAQEQYYGEFHTYATASAAGVRSANGSIIWSPSSGVTVLPAGTTGKSNGWNAQLVRAGTNKSCSIFLGYGGVGAFAGEGQVEGEPTCR